MRLSFGEDILVADSSGTERTVITSTGGIIANDAKLNYIESGTTSANLVSYGVSLLETSTAAGTMKKYTLNAPIAGIFKDLVLASTVAPAGSSDATQVGTGSTAIRIVSFGSTAIASEFTNIAMQVPYTYARLLGLSTSRWAMVAFESASTNVAYKALGGGSSGLSTGIAST
jgi:hypothetical protein